MITRLLVPALAGLVLVSSVALAASPDTNKPAATPTKKTKVVHATAQSCSSLAAQFDTTIKEKAKASKAKTAIKQRAEGGKLCDGKKYDAGAKKIRSALKTLGVKPTA